MCSAPDKATQKVMSNLQGLMNGLPERAEHRVELASHITGGMNSRDIRSQFSGSISKKTIENARKLSRAAGDQKGPSSSDTKSSFQTINETKAENSQAVITPVASSRRKKGCKRKRQNDSTTAAMVDHLRSKMYTTSGSAADSYILPIKKFEAYLDFRSQYTKILKRLDEDTVTTARTRRHLQKIKQLPTIKVATWSDHRRKRRKNRLRK